MGSLWEGVSLNFSGILKNRVLGNALCKSNVKPILIVKYVNIPVVMRREEVEIFLEHLNGIHPKVIFTYEFEENDKLNFLDITIIRLEDKLKFIIFSDTYFHVTLLKLSPASLSPTRIPTCL